MRTRALTLLLALTAVGCGGPTTVQAPHVTPSGFLTDSSLLRPGGEGEARLVYRAPDADLSRYDKLVLDPVMVWGRARGADDLPRAEVQRLADLLYGTLLAELGSYYVIVREGGPGVMRLRAALTEAQESSVYLDIQSSLGPVTGLVSGTKQMATGTHAFVGAASVEAEVLDTETGAVLFAGADRRVGTKTLKGATDPWGDVQAAFREWAARLIARLQAAGGPTRPLPYWAQPR